MKKLTTARRHYQIIVTAKRTVRSLKSKRKSHERRCLTSLQPGQKPAARRAWQRTKPNSRRPTISIAAPKIFDVSLEKPRAAVLQFLKELRSFTLVNGRRVRIDFHETRTMRPDGTLLFAAELDRINRQTKPKKLVRCNHPSDNIVEQVLQHLGLLDMMNQKGRVAVSAENVKYWKVDSDNRVDGQHAAPVIEEYQRLFPGNEAKKLYNGLTEAMTNCKHHAYTKKRKDNTNTRQDTRWWMFSQLKDNELFVSICDLGIGIPASLLEGKRWAIAQVFEVVNKIGLTRKDSYFIKAAMVLGRSRTNEEHRGKGLQELKNVIDSVGAGYLRILSNRGFYHYSAESKQETLHDFANSIMGTLIQWKIPIPKGE